ncbi:hypothetical protein GA0111570_105271 [Raineyella antarctica]|uniref:DUF4352 domain-containing protein n=2 Tax=Raineyella antarctica TaxID=1577474 RepID=A0A1G6GXZ6_9ACTN|nr:hypothetical protein GA0111570_105271 [Raineyella antarctica]
MAAVLVGAAALGAALFTTQQPPDRSPLPSPTPTVTASPEVLVPFRALVDYVSSEGSGRFAATGHGRIGGTTVVDLELTARTGRQTYTLVAYDQRGGRHTAEPMDASTPSPASGTIVAGQTVRGRVGFNAPPGPLVVALVNDRGEDVAALHIP